MRLLSCGMCPTQPLKTLPRRPATRKSLDFFPPPSIPLRSATTNATLAPYPRSPKPCATPTKKSKPTPRKTKEASNAFQRLP